jgi:hypothetical protein
MTPVSSSGTRLTHHETVADWRYQTAVTPIEDAEETATTHNESVHGGEQTAVAVNAENNDKMKSVLNRMKELAPGEEYENFVRRLWRGNGPFFCPSKKYKNIVPEEDQSQY